jgi:hypothetical protein
MSPNDRPADPAPLLSWFISIHLILDRSYCVYNVAHMASFLRRIPDDFIGSIGRRVAGIDRRRDGERSERLASLSDIG